MSNFINTENSLSKKGYSENAIKEITRWGLLNTSQEEVHIPNLKAKKRIGVTRKLSVDNLEQGYSDDFAVILKPFSRNREKIDSHNIDNIDKLLQIEHSLGCSEDTKKSNSDIIKSTVRLLVEIGKEWKWDIIVFSDINSQTGHVSGKSAGSTIYLTLLSASQSIPISEKVAITGALDEKNSKIKAIGGVRGKITAAVEKGANIIILPEENREDYDEEVPDHAKEKINETVFVKTTKDLLDFLVDNHVCYQCEEKISDYSYSRKDEQDKKFCSDNCRTTYFKTNYSKCNKCSGEIKVGDEYYYSESSLEIKTCVSCKEVEKKTKKNKDQEFTEKIDEFKQQNKENEVVRKLCQEIEEKIERDNYIFLTSQEEELLGSKIVKSVKIHNQSLDEKFSKQSFQNNLEKENSDREKYFFWFFFIIIIIYLVSAASYSSDKKKK